MSISIKRLRLVIIILACLLVATLFGFFVYARYRIRHIAKDLPGKLGLDIQQSANGYTVSRSEKGHTTFTLHASKLVSFKSNGHAILHDVAITLYGPQGSNREDHVYGKDFDYDQKNGVASAQGEVQIDLQSPQDKDNAGDTGKGRIHVKASGLVFDQKSGVATTDQPVEFQLTKASGNAIGANFDSKQGVLILNKQVVFNSSTNDEPVIIHATHAQLVRDSQQAFLLNAESEFRNERSTAQEAIIYFRKDGSAEKINARGNVHTVMEGGAECTSQRADIVLDEKSQPQQALLTGGVNFLSNDAAQSMHGNAVEGTLNFADGGQLRHAQFRNAVSFVDHQLQLADDPRGSATRQISASKLDVDFTTGADKKAVAQKALAQGNALATLRVISSKAPEQNTTIAGDQLLATLAGDGRTVKQLDGSGHTKITDLAKDGSMNVSSGDRLHMTFVPQRANVLSASAKKQTAGRSASPSAPVGMTASRGKNQPMQFGEASQIDTAVQDGNVTVSQIPAKDAKPVNGAPPAPLNASAAHAEYHAADQVLHLTGNPRVNNGAVDLAAQLIDYHRDSGDATANGSVKATYLKQQGNNASSPAGATMFGGQGPVHIVSQSATLNHTTGDSVFHGQAKMWQGPDSVSAPVIELLKAQQTIRAHNEDAKSAQPIDTTIASAMGAKKQQGIVRVKSRTLVYSDVERRGDFDGDVMASGPNSVIRSDKAQFFLLPVQKGSGQNKAANSQSNSQIDRIIATGHVVLTQPGRKGEGEKLVYTAQDGHYVLTGTSSMPPRVTDQVRGATSGAALIFNDQDDSVEVSGGPSSAVTTTRAPK